MKTIIATSPVKVKSVSASFAGFDHSLTDFAGEAAELLEDIAKAFGTKAKFQTLYGINTKVKLNNSNVSIADAIALLDKNTSNYGWSFDNTSTVKAFEVRIQFNRIGFIVTGKLDNGFVQQNTMYLLLG